MGGIPGGKNVVFNKLTSWLPISNSNLVMQVSINISILSYEVEASMSIKYYL